MAVTVSTQYLLYDTYDYIRPVSNDVIVLKPCLLYKKLCYKLANLYHRSYFSQYLEIDIREHTCDINENDSGSHEFKDLNSKY